MKKKTAALFSIAILLFLIGCTQQPTGSAKGHLIIIGGGSRPDVVMNKFVELAGGSDARIAIIPMASKYYLEAGERYESEFRNLGVATAQAFFIKDSLAANSDSVITALESFTGYFFGGGIQSHLTEIFNGTRAMELFHRRYQEGAVLGGTSAGAAIMSKIMITGDGNWNVLMKDSVDYTSGFGFIGNAIIDQHFVRRNRFNRLLALVMELRTTGIGIDESTAIWVKPDGEAEVIGNSVVLVLRPQEAVFPDTLYHHLLTGQDMQLSVYHHGEHFSLN